MYLLSFEEGHLVSCLNDAVWLRYLVLNSFAVSPGFGGWSLSQWT